MTQSSRPTAQHTDNYPDGDSGPYSSLQWREVFQALFTGNDDEGPIGGYLNDLQGSTFAGLVTLQAGAAVVGGNVYFTDSTVAFNPPHPTATRYDYLVVCLNDTDTAMTTSDAGYTLIFPTDLTDYDGSSSIPPYSCRAVIVQGQEGMGYPTLDQNDDHWMIPIASYFITSTGTIGSFTDRRAFINRRGFWVPAIRGYNYDTAAEITPSLSGVGAGWTPPNDVYQAIALPDAVESFALGQFSIPADFACDMVITPVAYASAAGNVYVGTEIQTGPCEKLTSNSDITVSIEVVANVFNCLTGREALDDIAGYLARVATSRDGDHASDTLASSLYILGWRVEYTAGWRTL